MNIDETVSALVQELRRGTLILLVLSQMKEAARMMEYEYAAVLRDQIIELRGDGRK